MKISYNWLQKHIQEKLPSPEVLKETIIFHAFEVEDAEEKNDLSAQAGDTIFDIKVLPDRAHDCLNHKGMAKEVAGLLGLSLKNNNWPALSSITLITKIEIQSDLCRRYIAVQMSDVKVGPSPEWLKNALESMGARSINNIVDATNFVLFDDGQPVHAYDADKIDGGMVVRMARVGEQITTLSQEQKILKDSDLVIADHLGPLAIAGVKGGMSAEVTESTQNIIIEIGNFDPVSVRKTSRKLNLVTDASKRFENEIVPEIAMNTAEHVVSLIKEIAGGEVVGVSDYYPDKLVTRTISFSLADITKLLGNTISVENIDTWISRYNIVSKKEADTWIIEVPYERLDIIGAHDIAEEIGRMVGYDTISALGLPFIPVVNNNSEYHSVMAVKYWLAQNGFREIQNYSFTKKGDVYIAYGAKDKSALRNNLSEALKESYEKNRLNAGLLGLDTVRIFEIGNVFIDQQEFVYVATCDKGVFEELPLSEFIKKYKIDISKNTDVQSLQSGKFKMWSVYPFVTRDIAVWCEGVENQTKLENIVAVFADKYCVREPVLFDRFEKPASAGGDVRTSVAYRLVFQSYEKTLTEAEVEVWFKELVEKIKEDKVFEIR
jgi:phenylalanyl-tRNA synthetase beta chain